MDRRQKRRILIFLLVPILASVFFITNDLVIRLITLALILIYVFLIIFLRDSIRFDPDYTPKDYDDEDIDKSGEEEEDFDDSFSIVSGNKDVEVITSDNFIPERRSRTTLMPPDLKERFEEIANEKIPEEMGQDGKFAFVLEKMLTVIKEAYDANTAIFFWYNKKKEKLSIEKFVSNSSGIVQRRFDIEDDILSKIVQKGEPELLNDISSAAEADVIRYYNSAEGIKSFVGVPLFYDKSLIAIIAVDSKVSDAFGIETIYSLGRFVRVITMVITIFEEKHSDTVSQQRLNGLLNMIGPKSNIGNEEDLITAMMKSMEFMLPWEAFSFVYYKPEENRFRINKVINKTSLKYAGQNLEVNIAGTYVGKAIASGIPVKIDDTSDKKTPRYSSTEDVSFDGSFLAVPLVYGENNYGVICFENLKKNAYSNSDVQFIKQSVFFISYIIHSYSSLNLLKGYLAFDIETKALNEKNFKERLSAELIKEEQVKVPGAIALIKIDEFIEQESLFEGNPFPQVLKIISELIAKEMTPLNLFGRLDERVFAVYFFNSDVEEVFLWAEKLRVKIARKPISAGAKQTTYTVSIGVASASSKLDVDEVIYNADLALQKAIERGGNSVRKIN